MFQTNNFIIRRLLLFMKHIVYVKHSPDDELVCSKHVEDSVNETNEVNKVCILLVLLKYGFVMSEQEHAAAKRHAALVGP